ncbi:MAG TPA: phosphoesterase, partial [Polyangiaceae bacterium]|nr:phosphoesterase [Polyangiaceae bacterium]
MVACSSAPTGAIELFPGAPLGASGGNPESGGPSAGAHAAGSGRGGSVDDGAGGRVLVGSG